jgi:hypothetical protein
MKPSLEGSDLDARARFEREAELAMRVRHPNVVAVHGSGTLPDGIPVSRRGSPTGPSRSWPPASPSDGHAPRGLASAIDALSAVAKATHAT